MRQGSGSLRGALRAKTSLLPLKRGVAVARVYRQITALFLSRQHRVPFRIERAFG